MYQVLTFSPLGKGLRKDRIFILLFTDASSVPGTEERLARGVCTEYKNKKKVQLETEVLYVHYFM